MNGHISGVGELVQLREITSAGNRCVERNNAVGAVFQRLNNSLRALRNKLLVEQPVFFTQQRGQFLNAAALRVFNHHLKSSEEPPVAPERFDLFAGWGAGVGGTLLVIVSSLAWGLGYFGQPHILVRYMALRSSHDAKVARRIGVTWTGLSLFFAVVAGFVGIAYLDANKQSPLENPEVVVLQLAQILFHPLIAGFVLAAVLAAVMSTMSSQLIVCASAIVEDIFLVVKKTPPSDKALLLFGKLGVLVVSVIALILALQRNDSILQLVAFAWAGFGAAFGPLVLLSLYWRKLTRWSALAGMVTGSATVFIWKAMNTGLYELLPAFLVSMLTMVVVSIFTHSHNEEIEAEFTRTEEITTQPK